MRPSIAIIVLCLQGAAASPPIDDALGRIEAARRVVSDPRAVAEDRLAAIEQALTLRDRLIREHPGDPRRAMWLADQASDLLFLLLPFDLSGLTSQFGLPSPAQVERAGRVARDLGDLAAEAQVEITKAISALEAQPGFDRDAEAQAERRRLADSERDRRIPFLRGVGAYLYASLIEQDAQRRAALYGVAADTLAPLGDRLPGRLGAKARLYAGLACVARDDRIDQGRRLLAEVAGAKDVDPVDAIAAQLGLATLRARLDGPAAGLESLAALDGRFRGERDLALAIVVADAKFGLWVSRAAQSTGDKRDQAMRRAYRGYLDLLDGDPRHRSRVLAALTDAAERNPPPDDVAPIVTLGRARALARTDATAAAAVQLLTDLVQRSDLKPIERAEVLIGLAEAHLARKDLAAASRCFAQVAREHATDPRAERAVELAAAIAGRQYLASPQDEDAGQLLREALALLLQRYPNLDTVDRWRYLAGRLALTDGRSREALDDLESITPGSEHWADAQVRRAEAMESIARSDPDPASRRAAFRRLVETGEEIRRALQRAPGARASDLDRLAAIRAGGFLALEEPAAALDAVAEAGGGSADGIESLPIRIRALWALQRWAEADRLIRQVPQAAGDDAGVMLTELIGAARGEVAKLADRDRPEAAIEVAHRQLAPCAEVLASWLAARAESRPVPAGLWLAAADALRLAERFAEASRLYDRVLDKHPDALEPLLGRAECLYGMGLDDDAQAMEIFRRIASAAAPGSDAYWRSQLRMLQIISRGNRNVARIAPHIEQLRRQDPELGGEQFRREFERLERKHR